MRSIFLLPTLGKIFDKVIYNQLLDHLITTSFLTDKQFGFRARHGTEHLVTKLTDIAFKAIDKNRVTIIVTLDLKRAFPSVNRVLLIEKLNSLGIET